MKERRGDSNKCLNNDLDKPNGTSSTQPIEPSQVTSETEGAKSNKEKQPVIILDSKKKKKDKKKKKARKLAKNKLQPGDKILAMYNKEWHPATFKGHDHMSEDGKVRPYGVDFDDTFWQKFKCTPRVIGVHHIRYIHRCLNRILNPSPEVADGIDGFAPLEKPEFLKSWKEAQAKFDEATEKYMCDKVYEVYEKARKIYREAYSDYEDAVKAEYTRGTPDYQH